MEPVLGIGTVLKFDNGEFTVFNISAKREVDALGNIKVIPLVSARGDRGQYSTRVVTMTGPEIEAVIF